ncbi:ankyrin repeat domain-containing protein [Motiliproteus sp. MSK22-1]|uniref:ankyrin repeat domain-containing protein n=1 Tax=Motiliproteus sp. MSK22-1 TaxID=1897630 RepID=UPI000977D2BE|nr:ankyrin repeat domain-containing protein [Motiliproteus sp. MSK22-1]OMH36188.1 hypothetical protein BGP75_10120 [Motiliproteus sp. MSK22-1]
MIQEFLNKFHFKDIHDSDSCGDTPLYYAVLWKEPMIAKKLLDLGANVNKKCEFGVTPLYEAISENDVVMVKLLLENGAKIDIKTDCGDTAEDLSRNSDNPEIIELLHIWGSR